MKTILHVILLTLFALSATAQTTQRTARAGADGVADTLVFDSVAQLLYLTTTAGDSFPVVINFDNADGVLDTAYFVDRELQITTTNGDTFSVNIAYQEITNEGKAGNIQSIGLTGSDTISFSVADGDSSSTNEKQTISDGGKVGDLQTINLSNMGGSVQFSVADLDNDTLNEVQVITLSNDSIILSKSGGAVLLDAYKQDLLDGGKVGNVQTINISDGVGTSFSVADPDSSTTNELLDSVGFENDTLIIQDPGRTFKVGIDAGGLNYFTESLKTTAPQVAGFSAYSPAHTNVGVSIVPKNSGAFMLNIPDGTSSGGGDRGIYAVDLQRARTSSNDVAASSYSAIVGGSSNEISSSASYSVVGGQANKSNGEAGVSFGSMNSANGDYSSAFGRYNTAYTFGSTVLGLYSENVLGSSGSFVSSDPLVIVGNGSSSGSRRNALIMLKNGNTTINGELTLDDNAGNGYTLPNIDGANGQVLKTDGAGAVSWQDESGSGGDTVVVYDSAFVFTYDTVAVYDTTVLNTYDTVFSYDTVATYDTVAVYDTSYVYAFIYDTLTIYDTTTIATYDTVFSYDTTTIATYDTVFSYDTRP